MTFDFSFILFILRVARPAPPPRILRYVCADRKQAETSVTYNANYNFNLVEYQFLLCIRVKCDDSKKHLIQINTFNKVLGMRDRMESSGVPPRSEPSYKYAIFIIRLIIVYERSLMNKKLPLY